MSGIVLTLQRDQQPIESGMPPEDIHQSALSSGCRRGDGAPWLSVCQDWMFHPETFLYPMEWLTSLMVQSSLLKSYIKLFPTFD